MRFNLGGVYIHIPFCRRLCSYCDFYSVMSLERKAELLACLHRELELRASSVERCESSERGTLYIGGGTPTVYNPEELSGLATSAERLFLLGGVDEFTVEANPDDLLSGDYLDRLKSIGISRLSIGIQSFVDRDLIAMKRRHSACDAESAVRMAQRAGFDNISIDLIYGFPGMSIAEWKCNIQRALSLGVQHLSAYHLTIEENTLIGMSLKRGELAAIDEDRSAEQYHILIEMMNAGGFHQYEVSNFALPGYESQHNSAYWNRKPYIGIGPSAHGYDGGCIRRKNEANNIRYINAINENRIPESVEILSETDVYNESLLTALRTAAGLDIRTLNETFANRFISKALKYVKMGMMIENSGIYSIPQQQLFVMDGILIDLMA